MLTVEKLNQHYGSSQTLRDVSFTAPLGACTAVLGRNGVGKTTLLRCLMGLVPVTSGSISFDGVELTGLPPFARARLGLGYVPQGREIFPRLTVEENIDMGAYCRADKRDQKPWRDNGHVDRLHGGNPVGRREAGKSLHDERRESEVDAADDGAAQRCRERQCK